MRSQKSAPRQAVRCSRSPSMAVWRESISSIASPPSLRWPGIVKMKPRPARCIGTDRGLSIAFDLPTQNGYDPDAPVARGEVGEAGVSICHWNDMELLFEGIPLQSINTSMTINATAPFILALYLVVAEKHGVPWTELRGTTQNDLLKEFVARGTSIFHPELSLSLSTELIRFAVERVPNWNPINCCGYHYMESGAGPAEEIGYAFGNALLILDAIRPRLDPAAFAQTVRRISFFINSGIELVPEICKIRA